MDSSTTDIGQDLGQRLIEDDPDSAVLLLDPQGCVSTWNAGAVRLAGYTAEQVVGLPITHLVAATFQLEASGRFLADALSTGLARREELWVRADGHPIWVSVTVTPLRDTSGGHAGFAALVRSLAGHRQCEAALLTSEVISHADLVRGPLGVLVADAQGRHVESNEAVAELLGCTPQELSALTIDQLPDPDDREAVLDHFRRVREEGYAEGVFRLRRRDSRMIWAEVRAARLSDGRLMAAFQDLTERVRRQEELRAGEARYRLYLEQAPLAFFVFNALGHVVEFNPAALALLGYEAAELAAQSLAGLSAREDQDLAASSLARLAASGRLAQEIRLLRKDGRPVPAQLHAVRVTSDQYLCFCLDEASRQTAARRTG